MNAHENHLQLSREASGKAMRLTLEEKHQDAQHAAVLALSEAVAALDFAATAPQWESAVKALQVATHWLSSEYQGVND